MPSKGTAIDPHHHKKNALFFAVLAWLTESVIHQLIFDDPFELLPSDPHELWMRCAIILGILIFGVYADIQNHRLQRKDAEKHRVFRSTLKAAHHILNNFLNQMQLFTLEAEKSRDFDKSLLSLYENIVQETSEQVHRLESLEEINEENIEKSAYPGPKPPPSPPTPSK